MRPDSKALTIFFRDQGIYLFIAFVIAAVFWAMGEPVHPFTIILYSLCIGNFLSPPMQWLHALYERPAPYDWLIFLVLLCVVMLPVYALTSVIVWWLAPSGQSLGHLIATGWKMPFLIAVVYGVMNFLYSRTRARLERRNVDLQSMVQAGAARLEVQDEELQRAREIQESLLPKVIPQLPGFEVASSWQPARAVGGDYFDVLKLGENRLAVCIADVSGKGVPAALLMANVQASLRASVRDMDSPARVCGDHQRHALRQHRGRSIRDFSSFGVLDSRTRSFRYCNAGHPYPILVSSGAVRTLDQGGGVLGVFPAWVYEESSVDLNSGDRLLLFTDGITEAEGPDGEEFGAEKVAAFAKAHVANSAAKINQQLLAQVTEFCGAHFQDDATLLVLAVK